MEEKIKSLTDAVNNTTESEKSKKVEAINTALKAIVLDGKFSVPKKDNPAEQESKTFGGNTNNEEIASIIESLIKDETDETKKNQYKSDLTAALQGARDALRTLASESQIKQAIENETTQTSDSLDVLSQILTEDAKTALESYTNKTNRSEMTSDPSYTNYIHGWQIIIVTLGASTQLSDTKDNDIDSNTLGPRTRAGIKTIQKYLNSIGISREDLGCKNNIPDGIPGPKTLQALLKKEGDKTRLQKMIEDKKNNSLSLNIIEPEFQKTPPQKDTTATSSQSSADSGGVGNPGVAPEVVKPTGEVVEKSGLEIKKSAILSNIQKIRGLEKVGDLKFLGITFNNKDETQFGSSGLERVNPDDNKDFSVKLKETYIIKDGKIIENIKNVIKISNKEWKIKSKGESINFTDEGDEYVFKINDITINIDKNDKNSFEKTVKLGKEIIRVIDKVLNSANHLNKFEIDKRNNNTIQADYGQLFGLNYGRGSTIIDINLIENIRENYGVSPEQLKKFLQALYNKKKSKTEKGEVELTNDKLKKNKFYVESHGEKLAYYVKDNQFYIKTNTGVKLNFSNEYQAKKTGSIINKIISTIKKNGESLDYFETGASNNTLQADYKGRYRDIAMLDDIKGKTGIDGQTFIDFMNEYRHDVSI